jgi:hypothetical protein
MGLPREDTMFLETHASRSYKEQGSGADPVLREMLLHDVYEVPAGVFEEIDATAAILCCPQCWETGLSLADIPHKPGCPLAGTGVS